MSKETEINKKSFNIWCTIIIIIAVALIIGMISYAVLANTKDNWYYINYTEATYKGYVSNYGYAYPIVEIDGVEYIASSNQLVRDSSYIGETVQIKYNKTYDDFKIVWGNYS